MKKISELINELTGLWIEWIHLNGITTDESKSFKVRKASSEKQEYLTKKRYSIIDQINSNFEVPSNGGNRRIHKTAKK